MGFFGSVTSKPVGTPATTGPAGRPTGLTPAAKQYLDRAVELSNQSKSGPITPENSAELRKLAMKLTPEDMRSMRYVSADRMREKLTPMAKDPDPAKSGAAKGLLKVLDAGILPGVGPGASVFVDSGKPASDADILKAKGEPVAEKPKVWQP